MFLNDDADVAFSVFARTQNMKYGQLACFVLDDGGRDIPLVLDGCTIDTQDDVVIFQSGETGRGFREDVLDDCA